MSLDREAGPSAVEAALSLLPEAAPSSPRLTPPTAPSLPPPLSACFSCELTWRQIHVSVPVNPSAEDVNAAFDSFCSNPVPVFEQGCADMAAQRWKLVEDYLKGKSFNDICSRSQLCWTGLMMLGGM